MYGPPLKRCKWRYGLLASVAPLGRKTFPAAGRVGVPNSLLKSSLGLAPTATAAMGDPDAATVAALFISWGNVLGTAEPTACYQAGALDAICLCPDCWGIWRSALLAAPRRPARTPLQPGNLLTHLIQVSQQCQAGAGANTFHARSSDRQRVRRWCLRALPRDWTAFPRPSSARLNGVSPKWPT